MARLMFIAPSAYPLGGVQTWLDYIIDGLSATGYQVILGLVSGHHHDAERYLEAHPFKAVERIENQTGSAEGRIRGIVQSVRGVNPDMVLSVNIADVYPAMARLKSSGRHIRTVMTLHGIQADFFEDVQRYQSVLDGVVCTNQLVKCLLRESGLVEERNHYAPYGVDYSPSSSTREIPRDRPVRIAYVGRYDQEQKRVRDVAAILSLLQDRSVAFSMRLAGDGPLRNELQAALLKWTGEGNVSFLGVLAPPEIARDIYEWADVLLVTSSWETGPIVIWEAMSHGVPVVTSAYIGSKAEGSLVDGHNCFIFPVGDCLEAVNGIIALRDPVQRANIIENGTSLISERYSKQASVTAWAAAIESILQQPLRFPLSSSELTPSGRLDRVLGAGFAEWLRQLIGRRFVHRTAGGEWPHSHSAARTDEVFLKCASQQERQRHGTF